MLIYKCLRDEKIKFRESLLIFIYYDNYQAAHHYLYISYYRQVIMAVKKLTIKEVESKRKNIDNVPKIMAVVRPDDYATEKKDVKKAIKSNGPYIALDSAKGQTYEEHKIVYDSSSETLEPIYFWVLDMMNSMFSGKVKKIIDNFASTAGSGHFSELQGKATRMHEEAMKMMQTIGILIKSIINLVYDLKDFHIRFSHYDAAGSDDESRTKAGILSLKQIWMDNVDVKRGNTSIKAMAAQFGYATLIDAFMAANSIEDARKLDLNERVKKIIEQRVFEFLKWKELSEAELRKRFEIEKTYLKNQISSLKMYTRWAKPYLRAASQLEMKNLDDPALVTAFNTIILQLTIMGRKEFDIEDAIYKGQLHERFSKRRAKKMRKFYSCVLIDFYFRGIPQKAGQNYVFGGRSEVTFRAYTLSEEELALFDKMLNESDINEALALAEGMTDESLEQLRKDLEYFLGKDFAEGDGEDNDKKSKKSAFSDFAESFSSFRNFFSFGSKKEKGEEVKFGEVRKDNKYEKEVRGLAQKESKTMCFKIFSTYKKAHGMPFHKDPYE